MPRPIRLLAAACMALFFFLMLQIMRSPHALNPPGSGGGSDVGEMMRDVNLDGEVISVAPMPVADQKYRNRRATRAVTASARQQLRPGQSA